jgi:hypothetical protein
MNSYCIDCGEEYELDALNLDLRCSACVEQWVIDAKELVNQ